MPPLSRLGTYEVEIDLYDLDERWLGTERASFEVVDAGVPIEEIVISESIVAAVYRDPVEVQRDHDVRFIEYVTVTGPPRWSGAWLRPVEGVDSGVFGAARSYNGAPPASWHHGHDIAAPQGAPVVASAPGRVVWTGELALHGLGVIVDHGAGVYSGYWHLSAITAEEGAEVVAGDRLGDIGSTGLSTGPHLHWEVIVHGRDVDPLQFVGDQRPWAAAISAAGAAGG